MILVTGATGKTGSRVLAQLVSHGEPVRAQIHDIGKADRVPSGADVVVASFEEPAAWDAAVSGCDRIYLVSPAGPNQRRQEGVVLAAARRAGAGAHIVKVGAAGLDDPAPGRIAIQHSQIRDDLRRSGLTWTVLALSQLMDNLFLYMTTVRAHGVLPVPAGDARITWVDADDVASVAVGVLTGRGHHGRTYDVTGPEALHHREVAERLGAAIGRQVSYVDVAPEDACAAMLFAGVPEWTAAGLVETNAWYARGGSATPTNVVASVGGCAPTSMAEFLARRVRPDGTGPTPLAQRAQPGGLT